MARPVLRRGSENRSAIRDLQRMLKAQGAEIAVDGVFGSETRRALTAFQKQAGLEVDGVAGKQTWNALSDAITPKPMAKPSAEPPMVMAVYTDGPTQDMPRGPMMAEEAGEPLAMPDEAGEPGEAAAMPQDSGLAAALAGMGAPRSEDMDQMQDRFRNAAPYTGPAMDMTAGGNSPLAAGGIQSFNPDAEGKFGMFAMPTPQDPGLTDALTYDAQLARPGGKLAALLNALSYMAQR